SLKVYWPDGKQQTLASVDANQRITLLQPAAETVAPSSLSPQHLFVEIEQKLGITYQHGETELMDFRQDRLMPNAVSTAAPKIVKGDYNDDGLEDLYLGGAKGVAGELYKQLPNGGFSKVFQDAFEMDSAYQDMDGVFFDADGDGFLDLYVVSGGSAFPENSPLFQDRMYRNNGKGNFVRQIDALPEMHVSGSSVTTGDFDKDGAMDLFVGSRFIPGKYPIAPRSYLLKNQGDGRFDDVTNNVSPDLKHPGLVTDAQFVELNGDDWVDLVVVGEWMEVGIYTNDNGKGLVLNTSAFEEGTSGWWQTIEAVDLDKDGDQDLILGNYGLNNPYKPNPQRPASLVYKDFDKNGSIDPIFSYYLADTNSFAFSRDELIGQVPSLKKKFPNYLSFAKADLADYFSNEQLVDTDTLQAVLLESVYLENTGKGSFIVKRLPIEAQFSPIFAFLPIDINKDGHLDLITGGNLKASRVRVGSTGANNGIVLRGDGVVGFATLKPINSALNIQGDIRDISRLEIQRIDYTLFSRNNDKLKIYQLLDGQEKVNLNLADN